MLPHPSGEVLNLSLDELGPNLSDDIRRILLVKLGLLRGRPARLNELTSPSDRAKLDGVDAGTASSCLARTAKTSKAGMPNALAAAASSV